MVHIVCKYRQHFCAVVNKNDNAHQEFERHICLIPFAPSERQIVGQFEPRALLWAIYLLGFQPVIAVCQFSIANFYQLVFIVQQLLLRVVTGVKPQ